MSIGIISKDSRFCRHTDVLIHDAQYLAHERSPTHGWGHSLVGHACALAVAAEVTHLILFHHDLGRTDTALDTIQENARAWVHTRNPGMQCAVAFEGLTVDL